MAIILVGRQGRERDFPGTLLPPCDYLGNYIGEVLLPGKGYLNSGVLSRLSVDVLPAASALLCCPGSLRPPSPVLAPLEEKASHP